MNIDDEIRKLVRTGRQPHPGVGGTQRGNHIGTYGPKKGRYGISAVGHPEVADYESDNDDGENNNRGSAMYIPPDENEEDFNLRESVRTEGHGRK